MPIPRAEQAFVPKFVLLSQGVLAHTRLRQNKIDGYKPSTLLLQAEREGFEPSEQLPVHRISSAARSTTPASFQRQR